MKPRKILAISLSIVLFVAIFAACTQGGSPESPAVSGNSQSSTNQVPSQDTALIEDEFTYPMQGSPKLTINLSAVAMGDVPAWATDLHFWTVVQERTGVTLEVKGGDLADTEAFNLMIASGDLPDMIHSNWINFPGGPQQAINQNLILNLNDVFDAHAPSLSAYLAENQNIARDMRTDEGMFYAFPFLRNNETASFQGLLLRSDMLEKHGLSEPETIDDWHNVLTVFSQDPDCGVPLSFEYRFLFMGDQGYGSVFQSPFNLKSGFWVENGQVMHGESQPSYKDFLVLMNQWYTERLINPDMPSIDRDTNIALVANETAWASLLMPGNMDSILDSNLDHPTFDLVGVRAPVLNRGDRPKFGQAQNIYSGLFCVAISAKSNNVEAAARFLDYMFSEEGLILTQFGTEGESFVWGSDGTPIFDDPSLPPIPDGFLLNQRLTFYRQPVNWPTIQIGQEFKRHDQSYVATERWADHDMLSRLMPPVTFTSDESSEYARLHTDLDAYIRENVVRFIIGTRPIDEFDAFVSGMSGFGLERILEIQQAAYNRFLQR